MKKFVTRFVVVKSILFVGAIMTVGLAQAHTKWGNNFGIKYKIPHFHPSARSSGGFNPFKEPAMSCVGSCGFDGSSGAVARKEQARKEQARKEQARKNYLEKIKKQQIQWQLEKNRIEARNAQLFFERQRRIEKAQQEKQEKKQQQIKLANDRQIKRDEKLDLLRNERISSPIETEEYSNAKNDIENFLKQMKK